MNTKVTFFLIAFSFAFISLTTQAQDKEYDGALYRGKMSWNFRYTNQNENFTQLNFNTMVDSAYGNQEVDYSNSRFTFDFIDTELAGAAGGRLKVGFLAGCGVGLSFQKMESTNNTTGYVISFAPPSGFFGNQGMDLASEKWALAFELRGGIGLGYLINKDNNLGVAAGIDVQFWGKGNTGWWVVPEFFGKFWDLRCTYKNLSVQSLIRFKNYDDYYYGNIKTNYISLIPVYYFPGFNKGLDFVGIKIESFRANADNRLFLEGISSGYYDYTLIGNAITTGIYFGKSF